jgi:hypothetical protein
MHVAPSPGAEGIRERQSRFSNAYARSAPVSVAGLYRCGGVNKVIGDG